MSKKLKRKRGGQPGNQNARRHGLYSSRLSADQICQLANALNAGGQDQVLIALRIKLVSALKTAPDNRRVLMEASKILSKWYLSHYDFGKKDRALFRAFILAAFKKMLQNQSVSTERIASESDGTIENLTERIEPENRKRIPCLATK